MRTFRVLVIEKQATLFISMDDLEEPLNFHNRHARNKSLVRLAHGRRFFLFLDGETWKSVPDRNDITRVSLLNEQFKIC